MNSQQFLVTSDENLSSGSASPLSWFVSAERTKEGKTDKLQQGKY